MRCTYVYEHGDIAGQQCKRSAVYGTDRCVRHGGGKPLQGKPRGHQNFKTGEHSDMLVFKFAGQIIAGKTPMTRRYEKFIPERLSKKYLQSVNDPEIIALNDDIALVETRIKQLIDNIDKDAPPAVWADAQDTFNQFMMFRRLNDPDKAREMLDRLEDIINNAGSEREAWDEVFTRLEQRMKLAQAEMKRRIEMQNLLNAEQAMDMVSRLLAAVNEGSEAVIDDEKLRKELYLAIGQRFARITGSGNRSVLEAVKSGTVELARPSGLD
jgi:hypothetical protein